MFGERVKRAVVWEYFSLPSEERVAQRSKLPFRFEVVCRNKRGYLNFYNMTEFRGRQEWWHGGSCMVAEEMPGGRRYHCNDCELDEDFDDLVFTVVRGGMGNATPSSGDGAAKPEIDSAFVAAADYVLRKNTELHRRLA